MTSDKDLTTLYASDFVQLIESPHKADRVRALSGRADVEVWMDILRRHPQHARSVAFSRNLPSQVMLHLARDGLADAREALASRGMLPIEVQRVLLNDNEGKVRAMLVRKSRLDAGVLRALIEDENADIARIAEQKLKKIEETRAQKEYDLAKQPLKPFGKGFLPILSADEFVRLLRSEDSDESLSSGHAETAFEVWMDVAERYPALVRVAQSSANASELMRCLADPHVPHIHDKWIS